MHVSVLAPHAYLAVDLFFVLSGFVLEQAYGARLAAGWSPAAFLGKRIRRLYPLYALGLIISILAVGGALALGRGAPWTAPSLALAAAAGAVMAPVWGPGPAPLYPLNFPAWTLLAELIANAAFAVLYRRLSARALTVWILMAALAVIWLGWSHGSLDGGATWAGAVLGLARAAFAFPMGVLLRRSLRAQLPAAWGGAALLGAIVVLYAPMGGPPAWLYDLVTALVLWPSLIAMAAAAEVTGALRAVAIEMRAASYGIYVTAVPLFIIVHAALHVRGLQGDKASWPLALMFCGALFAAAFIVRRVMAKGRAPAT